MSSWLAGCGLPGMRVNVWMPERTVRGQVNHLNCDMIQAPYQAATTAGSRGWHDNHSRRVRGSQLLLLSKALLTFRSARSSSRARQAPACGSCRRGRAAAHPVPTQLP